MLTTKFDWKRPLSYVLLPLFFLMMFFGFPAPMAPPPAWKLGPAHSGSLKEEDGDDQ